MISDFNYQEWLDNPTGKIGKGEYCSYCARFNTRPMAVNAILLKENHVLLVQRAMEPDKGWWDIPGGYLDWDETLEEGTTRELKEETGLDADPNSFKLVGTYSNPKNKVGNQVVEIYFISKVFSGEIKEEEGEVVEAKWFDLNELPENVAFDHINVLEGLKNFLN